MDNVISSDSASSVELRHKTYSQNVITINDSDSDMSIEETTRTTIAPIITQARSDSNSNEDLNTSNNELLPKEKQLSEFI